jgi:hypothetical protein
MFLKNIFLGGLQGIGREVMAWLLLSFGGVTGILFFAWDYLPANVQSVLSFFRTWLFTPHGVYGYVIIIIAVIFCIIARVFWRMHSSHKKRESDLLNTLNQQKESENNTRSISPNDYVEDEVNHVVFCWDWSDGKPVNVKATCWDCFGELDGPRPGSGQIGSASFYCNRCLEEWPSWYKTKDEFVKEWTMEIERRVRNGDYLKRVPHMEGWKPLRRENKDKRNPFLAYKAK